MDLIEKIKNKLEAYEPLKINITLIFRYLVSAFIWIVLLEHFLNYFFSTGKIHNLIHISNKILFIVFSIVVIYFLIVKSIDQKYLISKNVLDRVERLKDEEEKLKKFNILEDIVNIGIWEYELEKQRFYLSYWNQNGINIHKNYANLDPVESIRQYIHPDDLKSAQRNWELFLDTKADKYANIFRIKDNSEYIYIKQNGRVLKDKQGDCYKIIGTITEITREKKLENKLYQLAYFDNLTKLPNEKYFFERLDEKLQKIKNHKREVQFSVFYLEIADIDNILNIVGSLHCNNIAQKIAAKLKEDQDLVLISHYYGNKFLLLFKELFSKEQIDFKAKEISRLIMELWQESKIDYFLNFKIGISIYPLHGKDAQNLISRAHHAMHTIKDDSQFYQIYDQNIYYKKLNTIRLKNDLRKAVENNELDLVYQPKLDLKSEKIVAFEALLRWQHPEFGQISPGTFIPIAEQSNLISKITRLVIKKVIEEFATNKILRDSGKIISINLSAHDLKSDSLIRYLEKLIKNDKLNSEQIDFEITESIFLDASDRELDNLKKIKKAGFYISLDDFGKGYSSLSYLAKLPIDILKIDMSFIRNLDQRKTKILTEKIIELSHELDFKVVAEGVETSAEVETLLNFNCDYVQGYYYYRPMAIKELKSIIGKNCNNVSV